MWVTPVDEREEGGVNVELLDAKLQGQKEDVTDSGIPCGAR